MEPIERTDLIAFIKVAKYLSFVAAAKDLGVSAPNVSKMVTHLEKKIAKKLFVRTTRQVALTPAGKELLPVAERAVTALRDTQDVFLESDDPNLVQGEIRINCAHTLGIRVLAGIVAKFHDRYPKIEVTTILSDHYVDMVRENLDMVIRIAELKDSSFVAKKLGPNPVIICAAPEFLRRHGPIKTVQQLSALPMMYIPTHAKLQFRRAGVTIEDLVKRSWSSSSNGDFLTELARQGAGIVARSRWSVQREVDEGSLVEIDLEDELISKTTIFAMYPQDRYMPQRMRLWLTHLTQSWPGA